MNSTRVILQRIVRTTITVLLGGGTVVLFFLAGYFLGFSRSEAPSQAFINDQGSNSVDVENSAQHTFAGDGSAERHALASRLSRLAAWLVPGRHRHASETRVLAEIGRMSSNETADALRLLEGAPNSSVVSELRSLLLLRWVSSEPNGAFSYWRSQG